METGQSGPWRGGRDTYLGQNQDHRQGPDLGLADAAGSPTRLHYRLRAVTTSCSSSVDAELPSTVPPHLDGESAFPDRRRVGTPSALVLTLDSAAGPGLSVDVNSRCRRDKFEGASRQAMEITPSGR